MKLYDIKKKWNAKNPDTFTKEIILFSIFVVVVFGWSPLTRIPFQGYINTGFRIFSIRKPSIAVSREIEQKKNAEVSSISSPVTAALTKKSKQL